MKRYLVIGLALLALCSAASADNLVNWKGQLERTNPTVPGWIEVVVNATETTNGWLWTYDITPTGDATHKYANQLQAFSLDISGEAYAGVSAATSTCGWEFNPLPGSQLQWNAKKDALGNSNVILTGQTARFQFLNTWGPQTLNWGFAMDHGTYQNPVPTPLPEPMSIMLGTLGLGVVSSLRKLRRK